MTASNHGLFGAVIAISLHKYPVVAIAVAPLSHFLLDAIPHFGDDKMSMQGKRFKTILLLDCTLAVAITLAVAWFWPEIALLVVICAFLAASPDLMWIKYQFLKPVPKQKWPPIARFHSWIQWSQTPSGAYVEGVWFLIFFSSLLYIGIS